MGDDNKEYSILDVWKEYESIAMHFNDLIMRLRLQALGGVAAVLSVFGLVFKTSDSEIMIWGMLSAVFLLLSVAWLAVWVIDITYYNRMLRGAVIAIMKLEELSDTGTTITGLNLSRWVERSVKGDIDSSDDIASSSARNIFYGLIFTALVASLIFSGVKYFS